VSPNWQHLLGNEQRGGTKFQVKLTSIVLAFSILKICHKDYLQETILALSNNNTPRKNFATVMKQTPL